MEILVSEPDAPGVRLKRRRPDCVRFLADAVQSMPVERGVDAMLFSKHRAMLPAGCQSQASNFELSAPAGTDRKIFLPSSKEEAGGTKE